MFRSRDLATAVSVEDSTENPVWREQEGKMKIPSPDNTGIFFKEKKEKLG